MQVSEQYPGNNPGKLAPMRRMLSRRVYYVWLFCSLALLPFTSFGQEEPLYEEIILSLNSKLTGSAEIPGLIYNENAYLPVNDFFDYLHIKNDISEGGDSIYGFMMSPKDIFSISKKRNRITYNDSVYELAPNDLFFLENEFYLRSEYFGRVFGLECVFNFRGLAVSFSSTRELPFIREQKREEIRRNISKLKGERKADSTVKRDVSLFHLGAVDWDISTVEDNNKFGSIVRLGLGASVAGGEANVFLNYNSNQAFSIKNQSYYWRYVDNDKKLFNQVVAGRVNPASALSLYDPLNGFQINNIPSYRRKSFGTYLVSNTTNPDWIVELYVNDVLVNYTKADASGFFSFEVPLVYGSSNIRYRYYGPWGEEKTGEERINIPFNFLPPGKFEYMLSAGLVADGENSKFSRLHLNYGVNSRLTFGSGVEYNSFLPLNKAMPFVTASMRLGKGLIISGQHTKDVVTKADMNYRLNGKLQLDIVYARYAKGQEVVKTSNLEEKKLVLSLPVRSKFFNGFAKLQLNSLVLYKSKTETAELFAGGNLAGINANVSTYALLSRGGNIFSKFSATVPLPWNIRLTPQVQYDYTGRKFSMLKVMAEKRIFKTSMVSLGYENNSLLATKGFNLMLKHNLRFAQTGISAYQLNERLLFTQNLSGGISIGKKKGEIRTGTQKTVGRGGLVLNPYLDYNGNGKRDKGEPAVKGLIVRVEGGQIEWNDDKTTIKVSGLEPYNKYYVVLDENSFDNPAWRLSKRVLLVTAQPNVFTLIEIPVSVAGEVSGYAYIKNNNENKKGIARLKINIYNKNGELMAKTLTEDDGYFSYLGLPPGNYYAVPDEEQLKKIKVQDLSGRIPFMIQEKQDGDIVEGLEIFVLKNE